MDSGGWTSNSIKAEREQYGVAYRAWVLGGSLAAQAAIKQCERIGAVWGDGDEEAALGLTEVFTLAMMSAWYRAAAKNENRSDDERSEEVRAHAANVLTFFDDHDDQSVSYFCRVDAQLNYDLDNNERPDRTGIATYGYAMLSALAEWFCGELELDLEIQKQPIDSSNSASFQAMGVPHIGLKDLGALPQVFSFGAVAMFKHAEDSYGSARHPLGERSIMNRPTKTQSIIALIIFLAVVPSIWAFLLYAALSWPVSLLWWLLLVGLSIGSVRGLLVALGDIATAWSDDEYE